METVPPLAKKLHGEIMIIEIKDFHCSYTGSGKHALVQLCGVNNLKQVLLFTVLAGFQRSVTELKLGDQSLPQRQKDFC